METTQTEHSKPVQDKKQLLTLLVAVVVPLLLTIGGVWWWSGHTLLAIEKAQLIAPVSSINARAGGTLDKLYVQNGDIVSSNAPLALVGNELLKAEDGGMVISIREDEGGMVKPGETVAKLVQPSAFRIVARLEENKGLEDVRVGQPAFFTLDTYGGTKFYGVVDEIRPISNEGSIAFSISEKRETKIFDVFIRFDLAQIPEPRQGLSAKVWIDTRP